ncbi:hypothetical protein WJX72_010772 [[Myrmecia] bisecta]|uniref:Aldehyde dehydrogenase domain-containing protein n=1 Tax=[Myrmecia] bisecta TaxID=41462 RepID=A0AAW1Q1Y3_9CHLO
MPQGPVKHRRAMLRFIGGASSPALGLTSSLITPFKPQLKPVVLPVGFEPLTATSEEQLEAALTRLDGKKAEWASLGMPQRAALLRKCIPTTVQVSREAAQGRVDSGGSYGSGLAEDWWPWMPVTSELRELAETLEAGGETQPHAVITRPDGQLVLDVFPTGLEPVMFGGWRGEVWIQPGKPATQAAAYRRKAAGEGQDGSIGLVLGAGNHAAVVALDILHKLIVDDCVVITKMNPVNEWAGPIIKKAFKPIVDAGYLEVVYGGAKQGQFLCKHPKVASIHLTGSTDTFDAIVWGPGNKAKTGKPTSKEVTGELSCVTPYIITPGNWSESDLAYHAEVVVAGLVQNNGHNCLKAEVVITAKDWPQREAFLEALRKRLDAEPQRVPYYPGSDKRFAAFRTEFPDVQELGQAVPEGSGRQQPYLLRTGLSPDQANTTRENWCGCLQEVCLPGTGADPAAFLEKAVAFANDKCWGTLSCSLLVPAHVASEHPEAFDKAVAQLRYGSVCVNAPSLVGFCITKLTWGGFPGTTLKDIGSGNVAVHNSLMYDHVQKSVLYAPWRMNPMPFWSSKHRNAERLCEAAIRFSASPNLLTLAPAAVAALRG